MVSGKSRVVTIGVYGFDEDRFFRSLKEAAVDVFCDIRLRRGMRGPQYAFVNSTYLQQRLAALDISYVHCRNLAPSQTIRQLQKQDDATNQIGKRARSFLSPAFIQAYEQECLSSFDAPTFIHDLGEEARVVALFCVEGEPEACHRSILARRLLRDGLEVEHIRP